MKVKEIEQLVAQLDGPRLIEVRKHHSQITMAFGRHDDWCIMWNAEGKARKRAILPGTDDEECQKPEFQWGNWVESPEYDLI